eukprot:XP_025013377.1 uncharacterized protein LOC107261381 [Ricinus communis]
MEVALIRANIEEDREATMARFLYSLNKDITNLVELQHYVEMEDMLHMAIKIERQLKQKSKNSSSTNSNWKSNWKGTNSTQNKGEEMSKDNKAEIKGDQSNKSRTQESKPKNIQCFKCLGYGYISSQCPNKCTLALKGGELVYASEEESGAESDEDSMLELEDCYSDDGAKQEGHSGELYGVTIRSLNMQQEADDESQRENIFHTRCLVTKQVRVAFGVQKFQDEVLCDVIPMQACHLLLGRPWLFDRDVIYKGRSNCYYLTLHNKLYTLTPLMSQKQILVLVYKESLLTTNDLNVSLPSSFKSLLREFEDVFPDKIPSGLPPIRGIEHQIDFVLCSTIPNRLAYRANPEETKELQRQVEELLNKGRLVVVYFDDILIYSRSYDEHGEAQQSAFDLLKQKLTSSPILSLSNFDKTFEIDCDASGIGI